MSATNSEKVRRMYSRYRILADSLVFGTSLLREGPGLSARTRWEERPVSFGSRARVSTRTPIPPIQWVVTRQNITPRGNPSNSVTTEAPVVVNPETASKNASTGWESVPEKR